MATKWTVTFMVSRQKGGLPPYFDSFKLEVNPEEFVLDAIERIWAYHDRSLTFRHACHHATCGACGMRVNGVEKLTCTTFIREVTQDGGTVTVEPLRNLPIVSDLVVDLGPLYRRLEQVGFKSVAPLNQVPAEDSQGIAPDREAPADMLRLVDCIECGCCISACPIPLTNPEYLGPAVLAGAHQCGLDTNPELLDLIDSPDGVWRCHSAFECTAVCPANVDPAWRIMDLRKQVIISRFSKLFGS